MQIFLAVRFVRNAVQVHPGEDQQNVFHAMRFHFELNYCSNGPDQAQFKLVRDFSSVNRQPSLQIGFDFRG